MGGGAFSANGLPTPRMPPEVYRHVWQQLSESLKSYYTLVSTPIEAPGKTDYGDIDIFATTKDGQPTPPTATIVKALHAACWKSAGPTTILAIPWPHRAEKGGVPDRIRPPKPCHTKLGEEQDPAESRGGHNQSQAVQKQYIQVDLHVCRDLADLHYQTFLHSHGDFWSMVGGIIRRFGLTCTPSGLFIRVAELESFDKNKARFQILGKPNDILRYLGLDEERFWQPMSSWEELMDYAATCRFHDPARGRRHDRDEDDMMNAGDRTRFSKRPMFRHWIVTYLPAHRGGLPGRSAHVSREEVIDEAKCLFGQGFASRFDRHRSKHVQEMREQRLWADVRQTIGVTGSDLTFAMKGLKREIMACSTDGFDVSSVQKAFRDGEFDVVKEWSMANWQDVGLRQRRLDQEASAVHLMSKRIREAKLGV